MIKEIKIGNFKSFGEAQNIPIRPITLIFGANSAGKSSILHSLLLIEEFFDKESLNITKIKNSEEVVDIGGPNQYLNQNSDKNTISLGGIVEVAFETDWESFKEKLPRGSSFFEDVDDSIDEKITVEIKTDLEWKVGVNVADFEENYVTDLELSIDRYRILIHSLSHVFVEDEVFYHEYLEYGVQSGSMVMKAVQRESSSPYLELETFKDDESLTAILLTLIGTQFNASEIKDCFNKSDIALSENFMFSDNSGNIITPSEDIENLLLLIFQEISNEYKSTYLGPLRKVPGRLYGHLNDELSSWKRLLTSEKKREDVNKLLRLLDIKYEIKIEAYHSDLKHGRSHDFIVLRDTENDNLVSLNDVGTGLSQLLPILVEIQDEFNSTVAIEQPEIHLHPALQSKWGNVLKEVTRSSNLIFETHSEHIIKAVQLEVLKAHQNDGDDGIPRDDLVILYVNKDEQGNSIVKEMKLDEAGSFLEPWPDDFFELSADLSFERLKQSFKSKN